MTTPADRKPSKPWRVVTDRSADYGSQQKAYAVLNALHVNPAHHGAKVTVQHWEDGRWVLYERAVITENGWEPA